MAGADRRFFGQLFLCQDEHLFHISALCVFHTDPASHHEAAFGRKKAEDRTASAHVPCHADRRGHGQISRRAYHFRGGAHREFAQLYTALYLRHAQRGDTAFQPARAVPHRQLVRGGGAVPFFHNRKPAHSGDLDHSVDNRAAAHFPACRQSGIAVHTRGTQMVLGRRPLRAFYQRIFRYPGDNLFHIVHRRVPFPYGARI